MVTLGLLGIAFHMVGERASEDVKRLVQPLLIGAMLVVTAFVFIGWAQADDYCRDQRDAGFNGNPSVEYFEEHCDVLMQLNP